MPALQNSSATPTPGPISPDQVVLVGETLQQLIVEAWGQGFLVCGMVVLTMVTISNMKRHVLLHKLILLELLLVIAHGFFIFTVGLPIYGYYVSISVIPVFSAWFVHSVIAWYKCHPFLSKTGSRIFITTVLCSSPFWIGEMVIVFFEFTKNDGTVWRWYRPCECLFRDPWWMFTSVYLIWIIKNQYEVGIFELIRISPRFGVLLVSMALAIVFTLVDIVITFKGLEGVSALNPYWKLNGVFKFTADVLFLDDFKKVLDGLLQHRLARQRGVRVNNARKSAEGLPQRSDSDTRPSLPYESKVATVEEPAPIASHDLKPRVPKMDEGLGVPPHMIRARRENHSHSILQRLKSRDLSHEMPAESSRQYGRKGSHEVLDWFDIQQQALNTVTSTIHERERDE